MARHGHRPRRGSRCGRACSMPSRFSDRYAVATSEGRRDPLAGGRGSAVIAALAYVPAPHRARPGRRPGGKRLPGRVRCGRVRLLASGDPCRRRRRGGDRGPPRGHRPGAGCFASLRGRPRRAHDRRPTRSRRSAATRSWCAGQTFRCSAPLTSAPRRSPRAGSLRSGSGIVIAAFAVFTAAVDPDRVLDACFGRSLVAPLSRPRSSFASCLWRQATMRVSATPPGFAVPLRRRCRDPRWSAGSSRARSTARSTPRRRSSFAAMARALLAGPATRPARRWTRVSGSPPWRLSR